VDRKAARRRISGVRPGLRALAAIAVVALSTALLAGAADAPDREAEERVERGGPADEKSPRTGRPADELRERRAPAQPPAVRWRGSVAVGNPEDGRLVRGVLFPRGGPDFFTWDPVRKRRPSRAWRRWGTDELVRVTLRVIRAYAHAHPGAPRVGVGDLSRPRGGDFGPRFGYIGHATHQNGLDVDIYYPRLDRRERPPDTPADVDLALAQDLLDRFLRAGAVLVYVGPSLPLRGPPDRVVPLPLHDNHLHVRIPG
jgi:hypothetical protein